MKKELHIASEISRLVSLLMVVLILSISVVQIFHSHGDDQHPAKTGKTEYATAIEKCQVCDFLIHKQQKEFLLPSLQTLQLLYPVTLARKIARTAGFYKFSLPGFTNKGPPSIFAFS